MDYKKNVGFSGNMAGGKPSEKFHYRGDGKFHELDLGGDVADALVVALSAIVGFAAGLFMTKRF